MIAQINSPHIFSWLLNAQIHGGEFLRAFATGALAADVENYKLLRPMLLAMMEKYPRYGIKTA